VVAHTDVCNLLLQGQLTAPSYDDFTNLVGPIDKRDQLRSRSACVVEIHRNTLQWIYIQGKTESSMACKVVDVRCSTKRKLFSCVCSRSWTCSAVVRDTSSVGQHITMRVSAKVSANITKMVDFYSQFNPSPLSIKQFIDFGKLYWHYFACIVFLVI
jgi:hypothetical protein